MIVSAIKASAQLVFLTGLSGSGKSTVGKTLCAMLDAQFIDTDESIVHTEGASINQIFSSKGEEYFRTRETELLQTIVSGKSEPGDKGAVIALGGGALLSKANVGIVEEAGVLIYLEIDCQESARRLLSHKDRPLTLDSNGAPLSVRQLEMRLNELLETRLFGYQAASFTVSVTSRSVEEICQSIQTIVGSKC